MWRFILGGDISKEVEFRKQRLLDVDVYIEKIEALSKNVESIFVFTDEYRHVVELKQKRPNWNVYTLCEKSEKGFVCVDFLEQSWTVKKEGHIKLFANIEICRKADFFVGTYVSNPDWFLNLVMDDNFYCAACDQIEWQVIRDKNNIVSKYPHKPIKIKTINRLKQLVKRILHW